MTTGSGGPVPAPFWPPLLLVTGPPAAGKTTLAYRLSSELGLPLVARDMVTEAVVRPEPAPPGGWRPITFFLFERVAATLLEAGTGLVLEAGPEELAPGGGARALLRRGRTAVLVCQADVAVLAERFERALAAALRQPGDHDLTAAAGLRRRLTADPAGSAGLTVPQLQVDTTAGYRPPLAELLRWVRSALPSG